MIFRLKTSEVPSPANTGDPHQVRLEIAGQERVERISKAARSMPWQVLLLELAWTAGPATFIAAAGGYYLGFGKELPTENAIFFLGYTVIFGLIGIIASLVHRAIWQPKKQLAQRQLTRVLDLLPDLGAEVRELRLDSMGEDARRMESAGYLLARVDLDPQAISLLVAELTGDELLAALAGKIEMYRRAGLHGRMSELIDEARELALQATEHLSATAPETAALLNDRLFGRAPSYEDGLPRQENFIERILSAVEQDDDKLMTLEDVEAILSLAFELLSGRQLTVLAFEYKGRWETAKIMDKLNDRWNRYRIAMAAGYSRLKALEEYLAVSSASDVTLGASGQTASELSRSTLDGIRALNDAAREILALAPVQRRARQHELNTLTRTLSEALRLYASARRACSQAGRRHALFLSNLQAWEKLEDASGVLHPRQAESGLQLAERQIDLDDKQKLALTAELDEFFREHKIHVRQHQIVFGADGRERRLTPDLAKALAVNILLQLEDLIELTRPEVQRAIYASPAPNLHSLEPGQSAATKIGLGAAAVQEVRQELGPVAERLASVLITRYQMALSPEAIEFLHRTYGARRERLEVLSSTAGASRRTHSSSVERAPRCNLLAEPEWLAEIERANRILRQAR